MKRTLLAMSCILSMIATLLCTSTSPAEQLHAACWKTARTQLQINECANLEASAADAALEKNYKALLVASVHQPGARAKVELQERAWEMYRNAYIDAMFPAKDKQVEYGSVYPMQASLTRAWLTRQHVEALQRILHSYIGE